MSWKQFLFWQLPGTTLVLALVVQGIAFGLSGVQILRDRVDIFALAVSKDPTNYRILLFGDSITRYAMARFSLGEPGEVANLANDGPHGLLGSLFLLQRYLNAHANPKRVVVAMSPYLYEKGNDVSVARYNFWNTFKQPEERDFLRTYVPGIELRDWLPAIMNVRERIIEPLFSLLVQWRLTPRIEVGSLVADADAPLEFASRAELVKEEAFGDKLNATLSPMNAEVLRRLCDLSKIHGFRLDIAWPPIPPQLESILTSKGALTELRASIRSIMTGRCDFDGFTDFNKIRTYPNLAFRPDLAHLFGSGWEQRYTVDMRQYLSGQRPGGHVIEAVGTGSSRSGAGARELPPR